MTLEEAVQSLDPGNRENFTNDGHPRLEVLSELMGRPVRRSEVNGLKLQEQSPAPAEEAPKKSELQVLYEAREELNTRLNDAYRAAEDAKAHANLLADETNTLNRCIDTLEAIERKRNPEVDPIRGYLASVKRTQMGRALRAQELQEQVGASAADIARALDPRAPIDQARSQR